MSVILISVIGLIIMVVTVIKINGGPIDARLPLENINWLFRKGKYKIVKDEERLPESGELKTKRIKTKQ